MKKALALVMVAMLLATTLVGCAAKTEEPAPTQAAATEAAKETEAPAATEEEKEPVTIECAMVADNWVDQWEDMKAKFESEYPWITLEAVGTGPENGFIQARAAANDLPEIMWIQADDTTRELAKAGMIQDISDTEIAKHMPQSYLDSYTFDGVVSGITQGSAFACMFCNMEALREAGWDHAPQNFEEWIQCCKDVEDKTDYGAIIVPGGKRSVSIMIPEAMIACEAGPELGNGKYEEMVKAGEFDFTQYPNAAAKLDQLAPFFIPGSASATEDDVAAVMADGAAAMAICGNWTAAQLVDAIASWTGSEDDAVCCLIPCNNEGQENWISVSPETGWGLSAESDDPNVQEAKMIFWDWVFQPENFAIMQNARGTVPVQDNLPDDLVILPQPIKDVLGDMAKAPTILMSFNVMTSDMADVAMTCTTDLISGNSNGANLYKTWTETLKTTHY